ncbi:MAG: alpha/beta hydrolase [Pseudomonadota bacterium]
MATSKSIKPTISMEEVGGYRLRVAYWPGEVDMGKRPLLFFNGIGANLELAFGLGEWIRDRRILTFDMPGVGGSDPALFPYLPWQMARVARKLCDRFGFEDLDVMGVSWGGAMAQQFAFQYRKRVQRLILAATTAGIVMVPGNPEALVKMRDPRRYNDPEYMRKNFATLYGDNDKEGAKSHAMGLMPPHPRGYAYQLFAMASWTSLPFIRFLKMPTLIMMGDRDRIVPIINGKILKAGLPNSHLHTVEDGGHLFLVTKAEESLPVITEFLDELDQEPKAFDINQAHMGTA